MSKLNLFVHDPQKWKMCIQGDKDIGIYPAMCIQSDKDIGIYLAVCIQNDKDIGIYPAICMPNDRFLNIPCNVYTKRQISEYALQYV
jgi:hypothetical protein